MLFYLYTNGSETYLKAFAPGDSVDAWEAENGLQEWKRSEV